MGKLGQCYGLFAGKGVSGALVLLTTINLLYISLLIVYLYMYTLHEL